MNAPLKGSAPQSDTHPYGNFQQREETALIEFDLMGLYRALRKRLGIILAVTVALTALVMVAVFQMTPLYTGQSLVLLDTQKTQVVDVQAVMSGLPADSATVDSQVEILRSRSIARRVIEKLDLTADAEFNSELAPESVLVWLDPRVWLRSLLSGAGTPRTEEEKREAMMNGVIDAFLAREKISRRGLTYVIQIDFSSERPEKAAAIANAIAETYVLDQLEAKFEATRQANEWLSQRLEGLRTQVQDSERAAELYRTQNGLEGAGGTTLNEQQLSELNAQLILARTDLAEKQAKYARARQILASGGSIESVVDVLQSKTISDLRAKEAELARTQADLSSKYGPRHPSIINIDAQRRDIERQIGAEVRRIVAGIQNEAAIAQTRVSSLEQSLSQLQNKAGQNNQALIKLRELEREAAANRAVYESFLSRFKETSQQGDLQTADSRVISQATIPVNPSSPRKGLIGAVTLVLSFMAGAGLALLLERLDNGLQTGGQIEQALGLPHLVSIPATPRENGADGKLLLPQDYLLAKPLSAFSEALRSLRSALSLSNVDNPPRLILFTSALPNEGKTTTAVSFARAAAMAGLRVVLIDCDLRHPSVHKAFGLPQPKAGLVELLAERLNLADVLQKDPKSDLDVLPVAAGSANPPDVLASEQMRNVLARLREAYDLVVIDTAPVLPVSDSRVLSRLVDETVFVVRWNQTPREAAASALKELRLYNASVAGALLTVVDTTRQAKYGYGDGGYYYGRYSRYYVN